MNTWYVLQDRAGDPAWNMAMDEALHQSVGRLGAAVLRFYSWTQPAATFGYFQKYYEVAGWTELRPLIRRPTGGGLVPHASDWTYSLSFPPDHPWFSLKAEESYRQAHEWVSEALRKLQLSTQLAACCHKDLPGQCFAGAEKFDVLLSGRKIAGAAQRRNKNGLLIQGSLQPPALPRAQWEDGMLASGASRFGSQWRELEASTELQQLAESLRQEKYSRDEYNRRR